jgi:hypothetical protein
VDICLAAKTLSELLLKMTYDLPSEVVLEPLPAEDRMYIQVFNNWLDHDETLLAEWPKHSPLSVAEWRSCTLFAITHGEPITGEDRARKLLPTTARTWHHCEAKVEEANNPTAADSCLEPKEGEEMMQCGRVSPPRPMVMVFATSSGC